MIFYLCCFFSITIFTATGKHSSKLRAEVTVEKREEDRVGTGGHHPKKMTDMVSEHHGFYGKEENKTIPRPRSRGEFSGEGGKNLPTKP